MTSAQAHKTFINNTEILKKATDQLEPCVHVQVVKSLIYYLLQIHLQQNIQRHLPCHI